MQDLSRADLAEQVIPSLQEVQERLGYIPREAITWLADRLHLSEQEIYGVASFYNNFRFTPLYGIKAHMGCRHRRAAGLVNSH